MRDRPATAWQVARWLTLALCALTFLAGPLAGARTGSYGDLQSALERGAVTQVVVESLRGVPEGYADGAHGVSTVRLLWQDGWHRSVVEVTQASSREEMRSQGIEPKPDGQIIGDVGEELRRLSSGEVEIVGSETRPGTQSSFAGWEFRGAWRYVPMVLLLAFLTLVVTAPQPRLATRAGWIWLALCPAFVIAAPLYLIVGARPHTPGRTRLTGIGAFLIFLLL